MAKNPNITRSDSAQINKRTFSPEHDAIRTVPAAPLETSFNLSHKEDSIVSKKQSVIVPQNEVVDAQHFSYIMAYSSCEVILYLDANNSVNLQLQPGDCKQFAAMQLKCSGQAVVQ